jgi:hypothetical protein
MYGRSEHQNEHVKMKKKKSDVPPPPPNPRSKSSTGTRGNHPELCIQYIMIAAAVVSSGVGTDALELLVVPKTRHKADERFNTEPIRIG